MFGSALVRELFFQFVEQVFAGIFQNVDDQLKSVAATVVWVWNLLAVMCGAPLAHCVDLCPVLIGFCPRFEICYIVEVHADDVIELFEVYVDNRAGYATERIAPAQCVLPHARVGRFAMVHADDSCRVDGYATFEAGITYQLLHDSFSRWAAANIAQADKEYADVVFVFHVLSRLFVSFLFVCSGCFPVSALSSFVHRGAVFSAAH